MHHSKRQCCLTESFIVSSLGITIPENVDEFARNGLGMHIPVSTMYLQEYSKPSFYMTAMHITDTSLLSKVLPQTPEDTHFCVPFCCHFNDI